MKKLLSLLLLTSVVTAINARKITVKFEPQNAQIVSTGQAWKVPANKLPAQARYHDSYVDQDAFSFWAEVNGNIIHHEENGLKVATGEIKLDSQKLGNRINVNLYAAPMNLTSPGYYADLGELTHYRNQPGDTRFEEYVKSLKLTHPINDVQRVEVNLNAKTGKASILLLDKNGQVIARQDTQNILA